MEIRGIEKEMELEYPKLENVDNSKLKRNIPKKWLKLGLTTFVFSYIMNLTAKSHAISIDDINITVTGGVVEILWKHTPAGIACKISIIISGIMSLVCAGYVLTRKIKTKKKNVEMKLSKATKILLIILPLIFVISLGLYLYFSNTL